LVQVPFVQLTMRLSRLGGTFSSPPPRELTHTLPSLALTTAAAR